MEAAARTAGDGGRGDAMRRVLVDADRVHRDAYVDPIVFAHELRTFWAHTWQYLGHASQVPNAGDVATVDLAGRPLLLVRGGDGELRVLFNRCAHKGTKLVDDERGHVGRHFRCPYHAWTYALDGSLRSAPRSDEEPDFPTGELGLCRAAADTSRSCASWGCATWQW